MGYLILGIITVLGLILTYQDFNSLKVTRLLVIFHMLSLSILFYFVGIKYLFIVPLICIPFLFLDTSIVDYLYLILTIMIIFITHPSIYKMILLIYPIGVLGFNKKEEIPFLGICCPLISTLLVLEVFMA